MWENAVSVSSPQPVKTKRKRVSSSGAEGQYLLLGQFCLTVVILLVIWGSSMLQWPFLPALRTAFEKAMQPEQTSFLGAERNFSKFTEQAVQTMKTATGVLQKQWNALNQSEDVTRVSHGKASSVPSGAREESYLPEFSLCFPLAQKNVSKTSGYGWRTDPMGGSGSDFHLGNDLAAAEGTPVLAAADGVVRTAGVHSSYGNYIRILHADGDETLYAHLQYLFVHVGQPVSAGTCLGTVGETGNATGPHLHFEILHKGIRYDPSEALQNAA